ncbi:MAG TPA: DUF2207 domain-containing protein, partial [Thermodesulfovibrionales bacterium]|nr:DUF2207 domain-containing protein [Thermodesulfovibrionales bacterium]
AMSVQNDGTLRIKETIRILSAGGTVERRKSYSLSGIYRAIGGRIQGKHAYYRLMGFEMKGATLDGKDIPWWFETHGKWSMKYIFLGPDRFYLSPGLHEFTLEYSMDRHVTFLPDHDEIFWWVFGEGTHGWAESIGTVAVTVVLPYGSPGIIAALDDHSWNRGTGKIPGLLSAAAESQSANVLHYGMVLSKKRPYLSVVVSMPKGAVREPDLDRRALFFVRDMMTYLPGLLALTVFFAYYIIVWARVGRDPAGKSIVPRYRPPADCSPAVARRLIIMGYDRTAFAAALLDLAAKGAMKILRKDSGYFIEKTERDNAGISPDEQVLLEGLFGDGKERHSGQEKKELDALNIHSAYRKHRRYLRSAIDKRFFAGNAIYLVPGILLSLVVAAINYEIVDVRGSYVKELAGLGLWTISAGFIARFLSRKKVLELRKPSKFVYLMLLFPSVLYSSAVALSHATEVFNIMQFMFLVPLFIMVTAHALFYFLLRAPTLAGRKAIDEIEGFRTYLSAAEGDRLDRMTPPEKTPALFEAYLPYALALGVENRWSEQFSGEIVETYTLPPLDVFLSFISRLFSGR